MNSLREHVIACLRLIVPFGIVSCARNASPSARLRQNHNIALLPFCSGSKKKRTRGKITRNGSPFLQLLQVGTLFKERVLTKVGLALLVKESYKGNIASNAPCHQQAFHQWLAIYPKDLQTHLRYWHILIAKVRANQLYADQHHETKVALTELEFPHC